MNFVVERLRGLVDADGRDQKIIAEKAGVTPGALSHWLTGKRTPKTVELFKLSRFFSVPSDYFSSDWSEEIKKPFELNPPRSRESPSEHLLDDLLAEVAKLREQAKVIERAALRLKKEKP